MRSSPAAQSCFPAMKASTNPHCWFCRAVTNQVDLLGARSKSFALSHQALPALFPAVPVGKPGYLKAVDWNTLCINLYMHSGVSLFQATQNVHNHVFAQTIRRQITMDIGYLINQILKKVFKECKNHVHLCHQ